MKYDPEWTQVDPRLDPVVLLYGALMHVCCSCMLVFFYSHVCVRNVIIHVYVYIHIYIYAQEHTYSITYMHNNIHL